VLRNVLVLIVDLFVMLFALFFLFRDADLIMDIVRRALPFEEPNRGRMIAQARELVHSTVTSGLIVAAVQGLLGGLAFAVLGISAPVFWGPAAIWLLVVGEVGRGVILVGLGAGIVGTADNFLLPVLLSGRARLNGLLVFISLLGGLAVFGLLGLVLGPIVVVTATGLLRTYTARE
jgi:predicted PurR-regulated permease PerM